jgi:hypothetical protein
VPNRRTSRARTAKANEYLESVLRGTQLQRGNQIDNPPPGDQRKNQGIQCLRTQRRQIVSEPQPFFARDGFDLVKGPDVKCLADVIGD